MYNKSDTEMYIVIIREECTDKPRVVPKGNYMSEARFSAVPGLTVNNCFYHKVITCKQSIV